MDKVGRRPLLLYPMIVMVFIMGLITAAINQQNNISWMNYISITCVIAYVICFAVGLGRLIVIFSQLVMGYYSTYQSITVTHFSHYVSHSIIVSVLQHSHYLYITLHDFSTNVLTLMMKLFSIYVKLTVETNSGCVENCIKRYFHTVCTIYRSFVHRSYYKLDQNR